MTISVFLMEIETLQPEYWKCIFIFEKTKKNIYKPHAPPYPPTPLPPPKRKDNKAKQNKLALRPKNQLLCFFLQILRKFIVEVILLFNTCTKCILLVFHSGVILKINISFVWVQINGDRAKKKVWKKKGFRNYLKL